MSAATMGATMPSGSDAAFRRFLTWSVGVHVGLVAVVLFVPAEWLGLRQPEPQYLTVSFGGGPVGPTTTGTTPVGGRTVTQTAPPPKRPEPIRPTTPPPPPAAAATASPKPAPVKPVETPKTAPTTARPTPPPTGQQVNQGNSRVETGATGEGAGLTSSSQGGLQSDLDARFCCPEWRDTMLRLIDREWNPNQGGRGTTIVMFTVLRDGRVTDVKVTTPSGNLTLDFEARRTMMSIKQLPALPAAYTGGETLTVRLRFPYGGG